MWWEYRQKYGTLFTGRKMEQVIGFALTQYFKSTSKKPESIEAHWFTPHEDAPPQMSLGDYLELQYGD